MIPIKEYQQTHPRKICPLCSQAKMPNTNHFLSQCTYLIEYMVKVRQILNILDHNFQNETEAFDGLYLDGKVIIVSSRVKTEQSPYIDMFSNNHPVRIIVDNGTAGNMVLHLTARGIDARIMDTSQFAR